MRVRRATIAALVLCAVALAAALVFASGEDTRTGVATSDSVPGQPSISIISPRNGSRQYAHAAVVKVSIENFRLAPRQFGRDPQLGQGSLRFALNRIPDCVDPVKLEHAINSPIGSGRLIGASYDYPEYSGPNGVLAQRIGTSGSYSPGTRPEIYYRDLPPGFYRLVVNLAQNNGSPTPFHAVTTFQVVPKPGHGPKACPEGKVPSTQAAGNFR
jgi:hypothetical protein